MAKRGRQHVGQCDLIGWLSAVFLPPPAKPRANWQASLGVPGNMYFKLLPLAMLDNDARISTSVPMPNPPNSTLHPRKPSEYFVYEAHEKYSLCETKPNYRLYTFPASKVRKPHGLSYTKPPRVIEDSGCCFWKGVQPQGTCGVQAKVRQKQDIIS